MKLFIKNMVCDRCIMAVDAVFEKLSLPLVSTKLGEVELLQDYIDEESYQALKVELGSLGFELLENKRKALVAQIKAAIVAVVHHSKEVLKVNLSDYLSEKLDADYSTLANAFAAETESTIEKFYIQQKIERVKELLSYGELTLSEIAFDLNYSSVSHLSAQFKKETNLTPTEFKQKLERKTLDQL